MFGNYSETRLYRFLKTVLVFFVLLVVSLILSAILEIEPGPPMILFIVIATPALFWLVVYSPVGRLFTGARGLYDAGGFAIGGRARFAGMVEEGQSLYEPGKGIFYGYSLHPPYRQVGSSEDKHMLTFAGSRSGKGASAIIPNLLLWESSVLCIDPKGTNTYVTAQRRRKMGQAVYVLDPFDVTKEPKASFNPLDILDPDSLTIVEDIKMIARSIVVEEEGKDGHFSDSARDIIGGFIGHVITSGKFRNPSLYDVLKLIQISGDSAARLYADMIKNPACGGLIQLGARRILSSMQTNEFKSVEATMIRNMSWMTSTGMRPLLTRTSFSFRAMKNRPTTIYLVIPPHLIGDHKRFLRLLISIAMSRYFEGRAKNPGLFIIDEAPRLGYLKEIEDAYSAGASYNLLVWAFFQAKGQLDKLYGGDAQNFLASSRAVQIFGVEDEDAAWVSEILGTRAMKTADDMDRSSAILSLRDAQSLAQEVGRKNGKQYIIPGDAPPFILGRRDYYKDRNFKHLAGKDPDYS